MLHLSVIVFRNAEGKILLQCRDSNAPSEALGWSFFGGVAEGEESPIEAIIREMKEELDINITKDNVCLLVECPWVDESSGEEKIVHFYEGTKTLSWREMDIREGAGGAFFTKDEIAQLSDVSLLARTLVKEYC